MNLKKVLMELGNKLVFEHKFVPVKDTKPIIDFGKWLNRTPEARQVLKEMGVDWPVVKESERKER